MTSQDGVWAKRATDIKPGLHQDGTGDLCHEHNSDFSLDCPHVRRVTGKARVCKGSWEGEIGLVLGQEPTREQLNSAHRQVQARRKKASVGWSQSRQSSPLHMNAHQRSSSIEEMPDYCVDRKTRW